MVDYVVRGVLFYLENIHYILQFRRFLRVHSASSGLLMTNRPFEYLFPLNNTNIILFVSLFSRKNGSFNGNQ